MNAVTAVRDDDTRTLAGLAVLTAEVTGTEAERVSAEATALSERAHAALTTRRPGPADEMAPEHMRLVLNALCRRAHRPGEVQRHLVEVMRDEVVS